MGVVLDMSQDYLVWDHPSGKPEQVTVESARRSDPFVPAPVNANAPETVKVAKFRALTVREQAASGGAYTARDRVCLIPAAVLRPDKVFKPADVVIRGDDSRWTALEVGLNKWQQTWRLVCRDLAVEFELDDTIDVERATINYDASGAVVKTFPPDGGKVLYGNVRCRVQKRAEETVDERGIRGERTSYDVIVERQMDLNSTEDRLKWRGLYLDNVRVRAAELITELPVIEAVLRP